LAVTAAAAGLYVLRSPEEEDARRGAARFARALARYAGKPDRTGKPVGVVVREIERGDEARKADAIALLRYDLAPRDFPAVFPALVRAMQDESERVRNVAAFVVGELSHQLTGEAPAAEEALAALLDDPSPVLRATAVKSLGLVAARGRLDAPPPRLVARLDDGDEEVRARAVEALTEYRKGPELVVPVALRRIPAESRRPLDAFAGLFWHVRLEPSALPLLVEGLSSEHAEVCLVCTAAINHMGRDARPALPAVLALLRKELESPRPVDPRRGGDIIGMAAGAIGELTPDAPPPPGAVELLCAVVERAAGPGRPVAERDDTRLAEAVWSLGVLGGASAPALPRLVALFEGPRGASDRLRGLTAEALAAIGRGTPDEGRVLAVLANAWETVPPAQEAALARALRGLGPNAERLVPELKDVPPDGAGSQIRPVRYPRSRRGAPKREDIQK
jgi:hypothetical protein